MTQAKLPIFFFFYALRTCLPAILCEQTYFFLFFVSMMVGGKEPHFPPSAIIRASVNILLLILRSQRSVSVGLSFFGEMFCVCDWFWGCCFFPTIEVVTFRLRGWCMLGVFLLPAFTHLGHECGDFLSPWDGMHVCIDLTSVYSTLPPKEF